MMATRYSKISYRHLLIMLSITLAGFGCKQHSAKPPQLNSSDVTKTINQMTGIMVHDVTNPPLAARFYAYACLAGYEVVAENDKKFKNMQGVLNAYPAIVKSKTADGYSSQLSAVIAIIEVAKKMQPSGTLLDKYEQHFIDSCKKAGFDDETIDSSKSYALAISKQILAYAKADKYNRISNYTRYTPNGKPGSWDPTSPTYMSPVEPYFNTIRPLTLDSSSQFLPGKPIPFSTDKGSAFYKVMMMNYKASGKNLTAEQHAVAGFWDCNPFAVQNDGHMLIGLKKISPGAHWMGITGIACNKTHTDFDKTMEIHTVVAIGLMDSFICCWDDKYRTNRIRPETAIRKYIDAKWQPLLQTPPFPEYISGHSVVSETSAVILTHYFGDNFHYTDNIEESFGITPRSFNSFNQAAKEAAISRFWGGIHFMDAIDNGVIQGTRVGNWVLKKIAG
jgi:PAP2 superfamily